MVLEEMITQGIYPLKGKFDSLKKKIAVRILNIEFVLRQLI